MSKPIPQLIDPWDKEWDVIVSEKGSTNLNDRVLYVPKRDSRLNDFVIKHELGHIKWSPRDVPEREGDDLYNLAMRSCEDCRVNLLLIKKGIKRPRIKKPKNFNESMVLRLTLAIAGVQPELLTVKAERKIAEKVISMINEFPESFETTLRTAEYLEKILKSFAALKAIENVRLEPGGKEGEVEASAKKEEKEEVKEKVEVVELEEDKDLSKEINIEIKRELRKIELDAKEIINKLNHKKRTKKRAYKRADGLPVGQMHIDFHQKDRKVIRPLLKKKFSDIGLYPTRMDRFVSDKMIFLQPKKVRRTGTILIDCSGSMSLDMKELQEILELSGGAKIACYSASAFEGTLHIVAEKNRIVRELPYFPYANVIDLPALEWLAKQKAPRIWVSDGMVTGIGDHSDHRITEACFKVVRENKIIQYKTLSQLKEKFFKCKVS